MKFIHFGKIYLIQMSKKNKILILTQYFPPETGAPQSRLFELALNLKELGWEIQVLTANPNYPTGKIFNGYKNKKCSKENINGLEVIRTFIYPTKSSKIIKRLACYFSFVLSSCYYGPKVCEKPNLIYMESPPIFLGFSGLYLSRTLKVPLVLNLSDLWPDVFVTLGKLGKRSFSYKLMKYFEKILYKKACGITCQTEGIINGVKAVFPEKKLKLIRNGVEIEKFGKKYYSKDLRKELNWDEKFVFIYAGLFGVSQGLEQIIEVASFFKEFKDILFCLVGDGPEKEKIENLSKDLKLNNVQILPLQPREKIPVFLASSDCAIISLSTNIKEAVPSKMYEAMASEMPLIVISEGEASNIVKEGFAGLCVPPKNLEILKEKILYIYKNKEEANKMAFNGRKLVEEKFNRKIISKELNNFLLELLQEDKNGKNNKY